MAIEKIKILGAVLKLLAKQQCQFSPFPSKNGPNGLNWQCCLAGSSKRAPINCHWCQTFFLAEVYWNLSAPKSWHNNLFISGVIWQMVNKTVKIWYIICEYTGTIKYKFYFIKDNYSIVEWGRKRHKNFWAMHLCIKEASPGRKVLVEAPSFYAI